jgi:nuclease HARBI1
MRGYGDGTANKEELEYNEFMGHLRVHVETGFGKVTQLFSGMDMQRSQRTGLSPTAAYYMCSVLFTNIHTCMHDINRPWQINPPSVEEYLS